MKICVVTNYNNKGYINEQLIFNSLFKTLNILPQDIFDILDINSVYKINKNYTHLLILFDYRVTVISPYKTFFSEVKIPKVFLIDTIPQTQKDLDIEFSTHILENKVSHLSCLSHQHQQLLYENFADGLIFHTQQDVNLFNHHYIINKEIPATIIPPSLGKEEDIKVNFTHFSPNKNIGFNGSPSYANGIYILSEILKDLPDYSANLYGSQGRSDISNEILTNYATETNPNIKFKGRLNNDSNFFQENHIYYNVSIYNSFNYFVLTSILNGMVPIISEQSSMVSYFPHYPFIASNNPTSIMDVLKSINITSDESLKSILQNTVSNLKHLNDEFTKEQYYNFLNTL